MSHAEDEQRKWDEVSTSEQMRMWGAYMALATAVHGDTFKAEQLTELLLDTGMKTARPQDQRGAFLELLFG